MKSQIIFLFLAMVSFGMTKNANALELNCDRAGDVCPGGKDCRSEQYKARISSVGQPDGTISIDGNDHFAYGQPHVTLQKQKTVSLKQAIKMAGSADGLADTEPTYSMYTDGFNTSPLIVLVGTQLEGSDSKKRGQIIVVRGPVGTPEFSLPITCSK